jgi:hypothetical protein
MTPSEESAALVSAADSEVVRLRAENERLREALKFYAEPDNWRSSIRYGKEFILSGGRRRRDAYYVAPPCVDDFGKRAAGALVKQP